MIKKRIIAELESTLVSAVSIYQDGLECATQITYDVRQGKTKQLAIELPAAGLCLLSIVGELLRPGNRWKRSTLSATI